MSLACSHVASVGTENRELCVHPESSCEAELAGLVEELVEPSLLWWSNDP